MTAGFMSFMPPGFGHGIRKLREMMGIHESKTTHRGMLIAAGCAVLLAGATMGLRTLAAADQVPVLNDSPTAHDRPVWNAVTTDPTQSQRRGAGHYHPR
jgi:hypothetical protein